MADNEKKTPVGKSIRELINPALEDDRREQVQLQILDTAFSKMAEVLPSIIEREFSAFFNHVASKSKDKPNIKNPMIISALTDAKNESYSPIKNFQIPVSTSFTTYSADQIKELPGYIRLHLAARDMDVALKVTGLTADEKGQAILTLDASKTYEEGAFENAQMYPQLPAPKVEFDRGKDQQFKF
ncbi:MAG: hypothetical protein PW788_02825 [Micavibrio sp.]|nr:hypothetical protein [Micavibrio sp.]